MRAVVELMFDQYPAQTQKALRRRLRSADNNTHLGAFFELALHDLLLRSECRMLAVEPDLEDTLRSPADRRLKEALHAIDSVHSPDFFLELHITGVPAAPVSGGRLRRALEEWPDGLDHQHVRRIMWDESQERPVFQYEQQGVCFKILPVPREASRGTTQRSRAIGALMPEAQWVQPQQSIKKRFWRRPHGTGNFN